MIKFFAMSIALDCNAGNQDYIVGTLDGDGGDINVFIVVREELHGEFKLMWMS